MNHSESISEKRRQMYAISISFLCYLIIFHFLMPAVLNLTGFSDRINSGSALILSAVLAFFCAAIILAAFHIDINLKSSGKAREKKDWRWAVVLFLICMVMDVGATGFNTLLSTPLASLSDMLTDLTGTTGLLPPAQTVQYDSISMIYTMLIAPLLEELVFRGLFYGALRRYGRWLAILTSALMFSLMHMNIHQLAGAFLSGMIYAVLRDQAGLGMSIALHILTNAANILLVPLLWESKAYSQTYYIVLLIAMILSIVTVGLCFSKKNKLREGNIAYLEFEESKKNRRLVFGNPVLVLCFVICAVFVVI